MARKKTGTLKIQWVVSDIACTRRMRQTVRGLGLRRLQQVVELEDTPSIRGMVNAVRHLVVIVGGAPEKLSDGDKPSKEAGN